MIPVIVIPIILGIFIANPLDGEKIQDESNAPKDVLTPNGSTDFLVVLLFIVWFFFIFNVLRRTIMIRKSRRLK